MTRTRAGVTLAVAIALACGLATTSRGAGAEEPDLVVVVHRANPLRVMSRDDLAVTFTLARTRWSDGALVLPFNLAPRDPVRTAFDRAVLNMSPTQVGRFWLDQRIRGVMKVPRQLGTPGTALRLVARIPGAIAYVPAGTETPDVRVVARIRGGKVLTP